MHSALTALLCFALWPNVLNSVMIIYNFLSPKVRQVSTEREVMYISVKLPLSIDYWSFENVDTNCDLPLFRPLIFESINSSYINVKKIIVVIDATCAVAKTKPEKNSGLYGILDLCDTGAGL